MPKRLTFNASKGNVVNTYLYAADGRKLTVNNGSLKTDYVGNVIYENGTFKRLLVDGGYYEGGQYYFYIKDHLGNNRITANQNSGVVQSTQYYPFGMSFSDAIGQTAQPYKYNGKELYNAQALNLYDYGARHMEPALGRFTTMDPLAEKYYSISPYAYCANNPMRYVDPDGRRMSPYYDEDGNFLGVDENGFAGDIYITTKDAFDRNANGGIADSKGIQGEGATLALSNSDLKLSAEAKSNILTDVLVKMDDIKIDNLYNNKVSIRERQIHKGFEVIARGYNNPAVSRNDSRFTSDHINGQIRITAKDNTLKSDLFSVESVHNYLGVHEYWAHGVKGWGDRTKDHQKAYKAQMNHPTYNRLAPSQRSEIKGLYNDYVKQER